MIKFNSVIKLFLMISLVTFLITGCTPQKVDVRGYSGSQEEEGVTAERETLEIKKIGYSIQVGAFKEVGNAKKLKKSLKKFSLGAYYFRHKSGLYKVRFGDFVTKEIAVLKAEKIKRAGKINYYYIVEPNKQAFSRKSPKYSDRDRPSNSYAHLKTNRKVLREKIVSTAKNYIGVRYQWGGTSVKKGFDCSGLAMVTYKVNGYKLPRTSRTQYKKGRKISRKDLQKGDLVFFDMQKKGRVSHVGIYIGNNQFIHAPGRGKYIHISSLKSKYFMERYKGSRTYI